MARVGRTMAALAARVGEDLDILRVSSKKIRKDLAAPGNAAEEVEGDRVPQQSLEVGIGVAYGGEPACKTVERTIGVGAMPERLQEKGRQRGEVVVGDRVAGESA